ncbi:hypothetical protein BIY21_20495 [Vibrio ponticus]|uniref:Uncharacterized protein n=1 Tax=Vibrio ponticus TaxID=265668 RepID=A0ABX3FS40_9VIBR|nr:hypothetical protein [Vibrio ponticus]OLQ95827.1 hypothetical protein BIY21_20495 [Vibrio ponticus]
MKIYQVKKVASPKFRAIIAAFIVSCVAFAWYFNGVGGAIALALTWLIIRHMKPKSCIFLDNGRLGLKSGRATLFAVCLDEITNVKLKQDSGGLITKLFINTANDSYSLSQIQTYNDKKIANLLDELRLYGIEIGTFSK